MGVDLEHKQPPYLLVEIVDPLEQVVKLQQKHMMDLLGQQAQLSQQVYL